VKELQLVSVLSEITLSFVNEIICPWYFVHTEQKALASTESANFEGGFNAYAPQAMMQQDRQ
jgi:hypothetical protein